MRNPQTKSDPSVTSMILIAIFRFNSSNLTQELSCLIMLVVFLGEPFLIKCMSVGVEPGPNLTLHLNGEPWEQTYPGQIYDNPLDHGTLYNGYATRKTLKKRD